MIAWLVVKGDQGQGYAVEYVHETSDGAVRSAVALAAGMKLGRQEQDPEDEWPHGATWSDDRYFVGIERREVLP